jgi:hypothetical protein
MQTAHKFSHDRTDWDTISFHFFTHNSALKLAMFQWTQINLPHKFITPINNKFVNFVLLFYSIYVQMHANILYQNKIKMYNCYPPEWTALIFKWYHLSWKLIIFQSIPIKDCNTDPPHCKATQCHTKSVSTSYGTDAFWLVALHQTPLAWRTKIKHHYACPQNDRLPWPQWLLH